jgi:SAM-dependent methyltransferase
MEYINPVGINNASVRRVREIASSIIINLYKKELDINVEKYFEGIDEICVCECKESSYRFYYPAVLGDDSFYEELQKKRKTDYYSWRWEHAKVYDEIVGENDYVLDIGCGSGYFLSKISDKTKNIQGLEFNDLAIEKCKKKNIPAVKSDIRSFSNDNVGVFDVVCAFQVLEHIHDVRSFVESCLKTLKPDGKLIIGVPNNNPYLHKHDIYHTLNLPPHHTGLWNKKSLMKLPRFFPVKTFGIYVEPNYNYDYWVKVQADYFFGRQVQNRCGQIMKGAICKVFKIFKIFNRFIAGRNILAVYVKQ